MRLKWFKALSSETESKTDHSKNDNFVKIFSVGWMKIMKYPRELACLGALYIRTT